MTRSPHVLDTSKTVTISQAEDGYTYATRTMTTTTTAARTTTTTRWILLSCRKKHESALSSGSFPRPDFTLIFFGYYLNVSANTIVFLAWYSAWFFALAHQKTKGTQEVFRNFLNDLPSVLGCTVFCFLLSSFPLEPLSISRSLRGTTTLCHVDSAPVVYRLGVFPVAMDVSRASSIIQTDVDDCDDRSGGLPRRPCLPRNDSSTFLRLRDARWPFSWRFTVCQPTPLSLSLSFSLSLSLSLSLSSPLVATTTTHLPTRLLSLWLDYGATSEGHSHSAFSFSLSFSPLLAPSHSLSLSPLARSFACPGGAMRCKLVTLLFFFLLPPSSSLLFTNRV